MQKVIQFLKIFFHLNYEMIEHRGGIYSDLAKNDIPHVILYQNEEDFVNDGEKLVKKRFFSHSRAKTLVESELKAFVFQNQIKVLYKSGGFSSVALVVILGSKEENKNIIEKFNTYIDTLDQKDNNECLESLNKEKKFKEEIIKKLQ